MTQTIRELQAAIHSNAIDKGFHEEGNSPERLPTVLCLIHSEVSEALEAYRDGDAPGERYYTMRGSDPPMRTSEANVGRVLNKPEGVPSELADIVIRVLDVAGLYGIDLQAVIEEKMAFNASRDKMHGGKAC